MANFSPKDAFQTFSKEEALELLRQRESRWFIMSLNAAMSLIAHNGADAAELKGARRLIDALLNLSDKEGEQKSYPIKELLTYDKQSEIKQEE